MKDTHNRTEMQWSNEHSTMMKEDMDVKGKFSNLTSSTNDTVHNIQRLQQQFQQRQDILQERENIQKERHTIQQEMDTNLSIREKELTRKITEMEDVITKSRNICDGLKRQRVELDHEKHIAQKEEMDIIQPAKDNMIQLSNRGEVLSKDIADVQEQIRISKQTLDNDMTLQKTSFNDISNQVLQKNNHLKEQSDKMERLVKEREESIQTFTNEMDQHENLKSKFDEATKVQMDVVKALIDQRQRDKMELKETREREVDLETVKMEMLEQGVEVIEATKRLEKVLDEKIAKMQKRIDG